MCHADELGPALEQRAESLQVEASVIGDRRPVEVRASFLRDLVPGDDVRVMLHLGHHDAIAGREVDPAPGVGDQIQRLAGWDRSQARTDRGLRSKAPGQGGRLGPYPVVEPAQRTFEVLTRRARAALVVGGVDREVEGARRRVERLDLRSIDGQGAGTCAQNPPGLGGRGPDTPQLPVQVDVRRALARPELRVRIRAVVALVENAVEPESAQDPARGVEVVRRDQDVGVRVVTPLLVAIQPADRGGTFQKEGPQAAAGECWEHLGRDLVDPLT